MVTKNMLKSKSTKVSLNIKIDAAVNERLKRARAEARKHGAMFNVSAVTESALINALKKVESQLGLGPLESENADLFASGEPSKK